MPSVVVKLLEISKDLNVEMRDYVGIVKADPTIATKILKSANSSCFGLSSHRQLHEVEAELLGFDHSMVGRSMLELWSLPEALLQAIEYHHEDSDQLRGRRELPAFDVIKATAVASAVSDFICTTNDSESVDRFRQLTSEFYGFSETRLTEFIEEVKPRIEASSEILSVDKCNERPS